MLLRRNKLQNIDSDDLLVIPRILKFMFFSLACDFPVHYNSLDLTLVLCLVTFLDLFTLIFLFDIP